MVNADQGPELNTLTDLLIWKINPDLSHFYHLKIQFTLGSIKVWKLFEEITSTSLSSYSSNIMGIIEKVRSQSFCHVIH